MMDFISDLAHTNKLLERIANALERIAGPNPAEYHPRKREASELVQYGTRTWQREQLLQELAPMGLAQATQDQIIEAALDEIEKGT